MSLLATWILAFLLPVCFAAAGSDSHLLPSAGYGAWLDAGRQADSVQLDTYRVLAFPRAVGKYDIENQGMPSDIEVEQDRQSVRRGHDPQLEKAVEVVMAELAKNPAPRPGVLPIRGISG